MLAAPGGWAFGQRWESWRIGPRPCIVHAPIPQRPSMPPRLLLIGNFLSGSFRTRSVSEDLASRLSASGWDVQTTSSRSARLPRLADFLATAWLRRHSYDVANVDVYSGAAFAWAEAVCAVLRAARKPYVLTLHGGNLPRFIEEWPGRVERLLRPAAAVAAPSPYLLEHVRHLRGDVELIPNALDLADYAFRERSRPSPELIWLRSFHSIYNPALAPAAFARVARKHPDARLTMLGADKGDRSLQSTREAAARSGVGDRITIRGGVPKSEVPGQLQMGDIFLNTTNVDNTPVSVLEALACGLCVVSTSVGGIPYLLEDGVDALLVPPGDPDAMASAIERILTEPGLATSLSRTGRRTVEAFDWQPILAKWQELFSCVARRESDGGAGR